MAVARKELRPQKKTAKQIPVGNSLAAEGPKAGQPDRQYGLPRGIAEITRKARAGLSGHTGTALRSDRVTGRWQRYAVVRSIIYFRTSSATRCSCRNRYPESSLAAVWPSSSRKKERNLFS